MNLPALQTEAPIRYPPMTTLKRTSIIGSGTGYLYENSSRRMITVSSNLATNILIELVTPERTTGFMRDLGAEGLIVRRGVEDNKAFKLGLNNAATARGFMQILVKLANREIVSARRFRRDDRDSCRTTIQ